MSLENPSNQIIPNAATSPFSEALNAPPKGQADILIRLAESPKTPDEVAKAAVAGAAKEGISVVSPVLYGNVLDGLRQAREEQLKKRGN